jgi:hypothetical protein
VIRRLALLLGTLVLALAGCGSGGGSDKAADAAANDAILAKLPTYPGATVHDKSVNPYFPEDGGGAEPLGHTTNVSYEVPPGTDPVAVVKFYSPRLKPDWRCSEERDVPIRLPSGPPGSPASRKPGRRLPGQATVDLQCRQGSAILRVDTDNLVGTRGPRYGYELAVDHNDRTP